MDQEQWQRYIDRTAAPEERKATLKWLQEHPATWEQLLTDGWEDNAPPMPANEDQRLRAELAAHPAMRPVQRDRRLLWWSVAASIAVLLGGFGWWVQRPSPVEDIVVREQLLHNTSSKVQLATLSEGSRIWLAPGAVLTVPADFNVNARNLRLRGEAYFEVTASPEQAFRVNTGRLQTIVLGTHFNIEAYEGETDIKVSLSAGKVAVKYTAANGKDSSLLLRPGTRMVYKVASGDASIEHLVPAAEAAWQRGALVLNNVPLAAALRRLEMRFNKKITYTPRPGEQKYITAIYEDIPLDIILRNIAFIHGFSYNIKGDTVIIR
jgi:ferric-dicitrate binding protein FerR (iron transport regulator)